MIRAPDFWEQEDHPAVRLLTPAAWLWQQATALRRARTISCKTPIPSFCIGNVTAGGAGKTPTALMIAQLLQARGLKPAFGNRGYGVKLATECLRVDPSHHNASQVGDEALLLAAVAPCYVSRNRLAASHAAVADGATHIIFDDGLQNPQIAYDRALLVLDGGYGIGNGRVIPAGPLREPLADALARVDGTIIIGEDHQHLASRLGAKPSWHATLNPDATDLDLSIKYLAFAGIGRPEKFFATCRTLGLELTDTRAFPDHHAFTASDLVGLHQTALEQGAQLITTAKDAARLSPAWHARVKVLPVTLELDNPQTLLDCLL